MNQVWQNPRRAELSLTQSHINCTWLSPQTKPDWSKASDFQSTKCWSRSPLGTHLEDTTTASYKLFLLHTPFQAHCSQPLKQNLRAAIYQSPVQLTLWLHLLDSLQEGSGTVKITLPTLLIFQYEISSCVSSQQALSLQTELHQPYKGGARKFCSCNSHRTIWEMNGKLRWQATSSSEMLNHSDVPDPGMVLSAL